MHKEPKLTFALKDQMSIKDAHLKEEGRALRTHTFCWKINMQLQLDFSYERLVE